MKIVDVKAYPTSFRVPKEKQVSLGIGTMTKRDCVIVKVTTEDGIVGWGESHHAALAGQHRPSDQHHAARAVVGMDATDMVGVWARIYKFQLGSHGMGAGDRHGDERHRPGAVGHQGQGGRLAAVQAAGRHRKPVPAYAGGVSLGYQEPEALVAEALPHGRGGLQGDQAARRRHAAARHRARDGGARGASATTSRS